MVLLNRCHLEKDIVLLDCFCLGIDIALMDCCCFDTEITLLDRCRLEIRAVAVPSTNINYTILRFPTSEGRCGVAAGLWKKIEWEPYDPTNFEKET